MAMLNNQMVYIYILMYLSCSLGLAWMCIEFNPTYYWGAMFIRMNATAKACRVLKQDKHRNNQ
jgi:hypothetical protein